MSAICWKTLSVISCGRLAGVLVPVVGVDLVADDDVAEALDAVDGGGLVVGVGLLVDGVGRPEVEGLHAELGGEEALGQGELEVDLAVEISLMSGWVKV